jgi:hypothetical protein
MGVGEGEGVGLGIGGGVGNCDRSLSLGPAAAWVATPMPIAPAIAETGRR